MIMCNSFRFKDRFMDSKLSAMVHCESISRVSYSFSCIIYDLLVKVDEKNNELQLLTNY